MCSNRGPVQCMGTNRKKKYTEVGVKSIEAYRVSGRKRGPISMEITSKGRVAPADTQHQRAHAPGAFATVASDTVAPTPLPSEYRRQRGV